jgi:hypothetical protein
MELVVNECKGCSKKNGDLGGCISNDTADIALTVAALDPLTKTLRRFHTLSLVSSDC